jgi:hypothetical protein
MSDILTVQPGQSEAYNKPGSGVSFNDVPNTANYYKGWFNTVDKPVDPLVTGFAFIKWFGIPKWVTDPFAGFAALTEKNLRAFDLPGDIELQTGTTQAGFSQEETAYINGITKAQGFTMTHKEFSGSPVRHAYTHWVTGIRDPKTGVALYPKFGGVEYSMKNHSASLLYIMTRPDATNFENPQIIEFASFFTNVIPLKAPLSHLSYSAGTQDSPELQMNFTGNMHIGQSVMDFASQQLASIGASHAYEYENGVNFTAATGQ